MKPFSFSLPTGTLPAASARLLAGVLAVALVSPGCHKGRKPATRDDALRLRTTLAADAVQRGDYELAAREYQSLLDIVGEPLREQGRRALTAAKELEPVDRALEQHRRLAERFEKQGQPKLAVSEWKSVAALLDLAITRERQNALLQPGDDKAAAARKKRLLARRREQADAYERLGKAYQQAGDKASAARNLSLAYRRRARLFQEEGRPDRAIEELMRCVTIVPDDGSARWALAEALETQGRFADAADQYRALARKSPADLSSREKLAEALMKAKRFETAAGEYRQLIEQQRGLLSDLPPGLPTTKSRARVIRARLKNYYTDLATALRRSGHPAQAENAERLARQLASTGK